MQIRVGKKFGTGIWDGKNSDPGSVIRNTVDSGTKYCQNRGATYPKSRFPRGGDTIVPSVRPSNIFTSSPSP
jgi:hypothetical protein